MKPADLLRGSRNTNFSPVCLFPVCLFLGPGVDPGRGQHVFFRSALQKDGENFGQVTHVNELKNTGASSGRAHGTAITTSREYCEERKV